MAHVDRSYHQAGYGYPSSDPPQLFHVEDAGWGHSTWTTPYAATTSIELDNPLTRHGVYPPEFSNIHVGGGSQVLPYMPTGVCAVQSTPPRSPENWAPQNALHPDPLPSPQFMPCMATPTRYFEIPNRPSASTNPPNHVRVPQRPYTLTAYHFTPAHPILFNAGPAEPGIRLSAALNRRFTHLRDRDDLVFESSRSPTITMRLEWPGYMSWSRQVRILDSRSVRQSISREKLAYEVAKTVLAFAQPQNGKRSGAGGATDCDRMWTIGNGNLSLDDLVLVRVENVSRGSWQPQFLVDRKHQN